MARKTAALLPVLVVLGGCSLRQLIYPVPPVSVGAPSEPLEEVVLTLPGGDAVVGWHRPGDDLAPDRPAMVFFHGNGENLETMRWSGLFEKLMALQVPFLAVDYPGYGRSTGQPSESRLKEAAEQALGWLVKRYPGRPRVPCGWSLGAALAVHLAASRPQQIDGLIALSPWTSMSDVAAVHFPGWLVGLLLRERYDSLSLADQVASPSLVIHGATDRIIPMVQGERLAAALEGSRWVPVAQAGHNDLLGFPVVWREIGDFVSAVEPSSDV